MHSPFIDGFYGEVLENAIILEMLQNLYWKITKIRNQDKRAFPFCACLILLAFMQSDLSGKEDTIISSITFKSSLSRSRVVW